ncbi:hypothetical protein BT69DRAFT_862349 [Atractiella rhizophila]|nr:hypothetical protein BT69DRAFT_862349 [Atractiella rhizophila]
MQVIQVLVFFVVLAGRIYDVHYDAQSHKNVWASYPILLATKIIVATSILALRLWALRHPERRQWTLAVSTFDCANIPHGVTNIWILIVFLPFFFFNDPM